MTKKYFAYTRVSTAKQGDRGSSLAEQRSAIEAYAARDGLFIARWFEDRETAAKQGRRAFSLMMSGLHARKADGLIIHKIDRSARNLRDWSDLGDLIDRGIDVRFVSDNFDLLSRGGRLSADIQAVVAADYIRNLREEVKKGMYGRLKQGLYPWPAPVGYMNTGKAQAKVVDPIKGPLVQRLFERYASNTISFEQLRHELAAEGLRTSAGKPLFPNSLTHILNNPFYAGVIRVGTTGETFAGVHEPLIPLALFERVQAILRGKTVPKAKRHLYVFRQRILCGNCQVRTLTGETQKGFVYYRCHGSTCRGVSWRADALERIARDQIARIRLDDQGLRDIGDIVRGISNSQENWRAQMHASLTLRRNQIEDRFTRLTDLLIDGAIDQNTFNARKEKLLLERQSVARQLEAPRTVPPVVELFARFELNSSKLLSYETLLDDEKRDLLDIVCSNFSADAKSSTFTLRSPYREIAEACDFEQCAPSRDDLRTRRIVEALKRTADASRDKSPTSLHPLARRHPSDRGGLEKPRDERDAEREAA